MLEVAEPGFVRQIVREMLVPGQGASQAPQRGAVREEELVVRIRVHHRQPGRRGSRR